MKETKKLPVLVVRLIFAVPLIVLGVSLLRPAPAPTPGSTFTPAERARVAAYWNAPGRHRVTTPPDAPTKGLWQVRLTPEASLWFLLYQRAVAGPGKLAPTVDAAASGPEKADWEPWVKAKLAYDRAMAEASAAAANAIARTPGKPGAAAPSPAAAAAPDAAAAPPKKVPATLQVACGPPPPFAAAVMPLHYVVTFDDGDAYRYTDHVAMRPRYAYYRFPQGTVAYGPMLRDMTDKELGALFAAAGLNPSEQRIARAVSRLEGGFETVNTYDTGFVSIGFIQFITAENGTGSLSDVLLRAKTDRPQDFARDFRRFGIDVDAATRTLVVVDPSTGAELVGASAVQRVIDDKRLTAVFQRAGRRSLAFRTAQIRVAKDRYWPADDPVKVVVQGREIYGKVSDVVKSEAGIATLFDRKVNRGNIRPFADLVARVMTERGLTRLADAAAYEREIIAPLKYRADFLADKTLGQPKPAAPVAPLPVTPVP